MLGSEYGWGKKQILEEVYLEEYLDLSVLIRKRRKAHYKILLGIVSAPHTEKPEEVWEIFEEEEDKVPSYMLDPQATIDKMGFERLKIAMADNAKIIIK